MKLIGKLVDGKFNGQMKKVFLNSYGTFAIIIIVTMALSLGLTGNAIADANDDRLECRSGCKEDRAWCEEECEKKGTCNKKYCSNKFGLSCLDKCQDRFMDWVRSQQQ